MPYYDAVNLVTVTRWIWYMKWLVVMEPQEPLLWEHGTMSPADLRRGLCCSNIWPSYKSHLAASWMHLHNCRCSHEHLRMLLQRPGALCLAPGGPKSICDYLGAPERSAGVYGRFACGFRTYLHFADVAGQRDPGHDQNTGSELHYNSWLLQGWWENSGGNSCWWNGNGSSAGIM